MVLETPPLESGELCRLIRPRGERAVQAVHRLAAPGGLPAAIEQSGCSRLKAASPAREDRLRRALFSFCSGERHVGYPCFGANVQYADDVLVSTGFVAADHYRLLDI